jgi:hypothetical protein
LGEEGWQALGSIAPRDLVAARLELHHAAQLATAPAVTWLRAAPDDSHPNLGWNDALGELVGRLAPTPVPRAVALTLAPPRLRILAARGEGVAELRLAGTTRDEAWRWLESTLRELGSVPPPAGLRRADYDLPAHPVAAGAPFGAADANAYAELARWFGNANALLREVAGRHATASAPRCWPHHFDLATRIDVERDASGAASRSIGVGLSPGDESYPEPYWYVGPWPAPPASQLPRLASGHWHSEGFVAAVLPGSAIVAAGGAAGQAALVRRFVDEAVAASFALHGRPV